MLINVKKVACNKSKGYNDSVPENPYSIATSGITSNLFFILYLWIKDDLLEKLGFKSFKYKIELSMIQFKTKTDIYSFINQKFLR